MKGISPIIASILLIAFTVSASLMLSGWFSSFTSSTTSNVSFSAQSIVSCSVALIKANNVFLANNSNSSVFAVNEGNADLQARASITSTNGSFCISDVYNITKYNSTKLDIQGCTAKCSDFQKAMLMTSCPEISHSLTEKSKVYYNAIPCSTCDSISSGLVLNMTFNEGNSTNITDSSTYGNNGNYTGETFNNGNCTGMGTNCNFTAGKYGNGISFDGVNDYISIPNSTALNISGSITIMAWFKASSIGKFHSLISKGADDSFNLRVRDTNVIQWYFNASDGTGLYNAMSTNTISANTWYHITGTYNGTNLTLYVNGVQWANTSVSKSINTNLNNLWIGERTDSWAAGWANGSIDSVRIWNTTLNSTQITEEMNSPVAVNGFELVGAWEFEEGAGNDTKDTHNFVAGQLGTALKFDGVNDYVDIGNATNLLSLTNGTIETWIKINSNSNLQNILWAGKSGIAYASNFELSVDYRGDGSKNIQVAIVNSGVPMMNIFSDTNAITDTNWHHFVLTQDSIWTLYIDRTNVPFSTGTNFNYFFNDLTGANILTFAAKKRDTIQFPFNSTIDEVKIYNRALAENEIKGSYYGMCG